ncbi:MAG: hypothetical protein OI74_09190 [Gammaproteobacteria bacterium (ex Lamellibrachia satsuma)]|nr:MAG: YcxB family protein [Gammaproteobacteria bacterium (ex Lamellibrachia satsuma)]RRS33044.1 MAG: hypothetical protein OI74_09190 [Gammaproteobacteria bacterium (ex Lamellibrachia satsuma)]RRS36883.1 MAG: hypothetical protein NV67_04370 [Gammaproteobacteria bacterium (ex Lamellibrachia satsuma)]
MEATYKISEKDYVKASQLYSQLEKPAKLRYSVAIPILLVVSVISDSSTLKYACIFAIIGGILGHLIQQHLYIPWNAKKIYKKHKTAHEQIAVKSTDEGIIFKSANGKGMLHWKDICYWKESSELVLVYQAPNLYHIIPSHIENQGFDLGNVRELLKIHAKKKT